MTAEEFSDSKYKPVLMPVPFGAGGENPSANYDIPSVDSVSNAPNFEDGFPSAFSSPKSLNGQYVTRKQINGIGNLATRYEFFRRVGGLNTFDADFAIEIGGYPRGCVLDFLYDNKLYKVLSLVDNNKVDFTGAIPTESQASHGITAGNVDGYNWLYCNIANQVVKYNEIADVPDFTWPGDGTTEQSTPGTQTGNIIDIFPFSHFIASKTGFVYISGSANFESSLVTTSQNGTSFTKLNGGFGIAVCSGDDTIYTSYIPSGGSSYVAKPPQFIYSRGGFYFGFNLNTTTGETQQYGTWNVMYTDSSVKSYASVEAGQEYSIYIINKGGTITDSTLKVILQ